MDRLIAETDVRRRSAYVAKLHEAFKRNEITPEQMVTFQAAAMPWCDCCRAAHSIVMIDGRHICLPCYKSITEA